MNPITPLRYNELQPVKESNVLQGYFCYSVSLDFSSEGQELPGYVKITGNDFILKRIDVHGYSQADGNMFGNTNSPLPVDRFLITINNRTTGRQFFDSAIDIGQFNPMRSNSNEMNITPMEFKANTELEIKVKHQRVVDTLIFSTIDPSLNPVSIQIIFSGSKLFPA